VAGRTAFTLRVQTGCAEACSYCIIPTTRGRPSSVPVAEVERELERIAAAGYKEIVLTGVHLGSYGRDLTPSSTLPAMLSRAETVVDGRAVWLRISSLEPMDCTREIVDLIAGSAAFAPHFPLPLQHASDRILAAMRRPYTREFYRDLVDGIRERIPHASIGSDVIVGFPGETDEDFEQLVAYLESSPLTHLHVFPYSDRPGTEASMMRGNASGAIVRERARIVREVGHRRTKQFRQTQIGTVHRALTLEDGTLAVTGNYLKVRIPTGKARNEWVEVRVIDGDPLRGEVLAGTT